MKIEQSVGRFTLTTYTDGHPLWVKVDFEGNELVRLLTVNDLHDLRYAIERQLAQIDAPGAV